MSKDSNTKFHGKGKWKRVKTDIDALPLLIRKHIKFESFTADWDYDSLIDKAGKGYSRRSILEAIKRRERQESYETYGMDYIKLVYPEYVKEFI